MSKTYRKERTKPKTTKPTHKTKYKKSYKDHNYELSNDYDIDMLRAGEITENDI